MIQSDFETSVLGRRLSELARLQGLTQAEIAQRCGISRIALNRFFRGNSEIRASDLSSVLEVLGIDLDSEINARLEQPGAPDPVLTDVSSVLQSLNEQVRRTLIETVAWWGQQTGSQPRALHRIRTYLSGESRAD